MFEEWMISIFNRLFKSSNFIGTVLEVNKSKDTCTVQESGRPKKFNVRLTSVVDGFNNRFVIYPAVDSMVVCSVRNNNPKETYVSQYGEIEEVKACVGSFKYLLNKDGHVFDDGENGGLTITPKLKEELNKSKDLLDTIKQTLDSWTPASQDGGAALKTVWSTASAGKQSGDFSQIENENVKH